jgi:hypothetical protein
MTEREWMTSTDPQAMLTLLRDSSRASERKLRLFTAAVCRHLRDALWRMTPVEVAEHFADGLASLEELERAQAEAMREAGTMYRHLDAEEVEAASQLLRGVAAREAAEGAALVVEVATAQRREGACLLLRDIFRPLPLLPASLLDWQDSLLVKLAHAAYDERQLPSGHLDPARLAVLADALLDAGCTDADLLGHLRSPGPHVRGCTAVEALLGRTS